MSRLTSRRMLKAHNTRLKVELSHLKTKGLFTELINDVRDESFFVRCSFCWAILFNKL